MTRILAIETSCDETAAAVVEGRKTLGAFVSTQMKEHALYGGVVPEIASRRHIENLPYVVSEAMKRAGVAPEDLDAVAVTQGPGLVGALLCGIGYAKALAYGWGKPLVPVNHIFGHICANYLAEPSLKPPYLCLVVSGGHSHLCYMEDETHLHVLGATRDDAAGEAFDKAARVIGLPYPGGPLLDELAEKGTPQTLGLRVPKVEGLDYSFSGLKTALIQAVERKKKAGEEIQPADIAASFRYVVVEQLLSKAFQCVSETGTDTLVLAGGVSANRLLRRETERRGREAGIRVFYPPLALCTDNAEMIGCAACILYEHGIRAGLDLNAQPSLRLKGHTAFDSLVP